MTDVDVEKIIKQNMNLQMNLAGIRADFEEASQRTWVGLTEEEVIDLWPDLIMHRHTYQFWKNLEAKLKEKNT